MRKKEFVVIFIVSVIVWLLSAVLQSYNEVFLSGKIAYSFFGSSCSVTGYPIALCINEFDNSRFMYYVLNITLWFLIITFFKYKVLSRSKRGENKS